MRRLLLLTAVALLGAGAPAAGGGSGPVVTLDVPVAGPGAVASMSPGRFDLVGVKWKGTGAVELRARSTAGRWGRWSPAAPEDEDRPDAGTAEAARSGGWSTGNPWWVGRSDRLQVRVKGRVSALRATFVRSTESGASLRTLAVAGAPPIVPRAAWGADESIRRSEPEYAEGVRLAIVHHTAGANDYSQAEAPAIVRSIQRYHVQSNGWNDIGYNFLVDRFGTIYEGRYGGVDRNVVGAHAKGFNTGSVGVAVLGSYTDGSISPAAERAVSQLIAWRLDQAHVDPGSTLTYISNGSDRFPAGIPVFLRAVSGHRDAGLTECPGNALYARLLTIAQTSHAIGLPKLYEPLVEGELGGLVRIRARLSQPLAWTVRVNSASAGEIASGAGFGAAVDWTWDATLAPPGVYTWTIDSGGSVTQASGPVRGTAAGVPLAFTGTAADPETITPNGDGITDATTIVYRLNGPAVVSADVLDAGGQAVAELEPARWRRAGEHTIAFDGSGLPDGLYTVALTGKAAGGVVATASIGVAVTRTLGSLALSTPVFSPNADRRLDKLAVSFALAGPARVAVRVMRGQTWVATPFAGELAGGRQRIVWDGAKRIGRLRDGPYTVVVEAEDVVATSRLELPFASDTRAPGVRVLKGEPARLRVTEPATITMRVNGARRRLDVAAPGDVPIPGIRAVKTLVLTARDGAGNAYTTRIP